MKRRRLDKGFTLMELLIVVAIIAVLASIGLVSVNQWRKTLRQSEYDSMARTIFVAAQNHLSSYGAANLAQIEANDAQASRWGAVDAPDQSRQDSADSQYYHFISFGGSAFEQTDPENEVLKIMLPAGSVDDTVRLKGNFFLRYAVDPTTSMANVLDVWYSAEASFGKHNYESLTGLDADARKANEDGVIGYYGGASMESVAHGAELLSPRLRVVNGDKLYAQVSDPNAVLAAEDADYTLSLVVYGKDKDGKAVEASVILKDADEAAQASCTYVLDDITTEGGQFANNELFASFAPGCNISIKAKAFSTKRFTNVAESVNVGTNSLFADAASGAVLISNIRHLENLSTEISGVSLADLGLSSARQESSLFVEEGSFWAGAGVYTLAGKTTGEGFFKSLQQPAGLQLYDGQGYAIAGLRIKEEEDAGLFSQTADLALSDLRLLDFSVTSAAGHAGAAAGSMHGGRITRLLAHNDTGRDNNEKNDVNLRIQGKLSSGGLVGEASGRIEKSAAALYVMSDAAAAGGLVGSASGELSISDSYAGGHTLHARYSDKTEGAGRVNVVAAKGSTAGGLVGNGSAATLSLSYSYASASVKGSAPGGLVGSAKAGTITNCYAVGRVLDHDADAEVQPVLGSGSLEYKGKNYYLSNVSENTKEIGDSDTLMAVSGTDTEATYFLLPAAQRQAVNPYDNALEVEFKGKYYFPTVCQLHAGEDAPTDVYFLKSHYGDFQVPGLSALDFELVNEDTLYLKTELKKDAAYVYLNVEGQSSKKSLVFALKKQTGLTGSSFVVQREGSIVTDDVTGAVSYAWKDADAPLTGLPITYETVPFSKIAYLSITLDDITQEGAHFARLFPELLPGENIRVRCVAGEPAARDLLKQEGQLDNSLFAYTSTDPADYSSAGAGYIRHLQNLDPAVSAVDEGVTSAFLLRDLDWAEKADFYKTIYNKDGSGSVSGSFYPIYNPKLTLFSGLQEKTNAAGRGHVLKNFKIRGAEAAFGSDTGVGNAGLFRYAAGTDASPFKIQNLKLENFDVEGASYTAAAVAELHGEASVDTLLAVSPDKTITSSGTNGAVGGLVGHADGALDISNSAASVLVRSQGAAGGLIGEHADGELNISNSYCGGHTGSTAAGASVYDLSATANIASTSGAAGGLAGQLMGSSRIENSFSAASVSGKLAGGIVGQAAALSFTEGKPVYVIAPVYGVRADGSITAGKGAFFGQLTKEPELPAGKVLYYLPEVYPDYSDADATTSVSVIGTAPEGGRDTIKEAVHPAFYDINGENAIAAKLHADHMQGYTEVYNVLGLKDREYPFTIWTDLRFDFYAGYVNNTSATRYSYYGDWQPVDTPQTEHIKLSVRYSVCEDRNTQALRKVWGVSMNAVNTDSAKDTLEGKGDGLWYQDIARGRANSVLLPAMPAKFGYTREKTWYVYRLTRMKDEDGHAVYELLTKEKDGKSEPVTVAESNGVVRLSADLCEDHLLLMGNYKLNGEQIVARFFIDLEGNNNYTEEGAVASAQAALALSAASDTDSVYFSDDRGNILSRIDADELALMGEGAGSSYASLIKTQTLSKATGRYKDLRAPSRKIKNHVFVAWYDNPELSGEPVNFDRDELLKTDKKFYAKYNDASTATVTLQFVYVATEPSTAEEAAGMIAYAISEKNVPSYSFSYVAQNGYNEWVDIPSGLANKDAAEEYKLIFLGDADDDTRILATSENTDRFQKDADGVYTRVKLDTLGDADRDSAVEGEPNNIKHYRLLYYYSKATTEDYGIKLVFEDSNPDSKADPGDGKAPAYKEGGLYSWVLPNVTKKYVAGLNPWNLIELGDIEEELPKIEGFSYYVKSSDNLEKATNSAGMNYLKIYCSRKEYSLSFDSNGGDYVEPVWVKYGASPTNPTSEPTKEGYVFSGWRYIHPKSGGDNVELNRNGSKWTLAGYTMPAQNMEAVAEWTPGQASYRVLYWYENANDDGYSFMYSYEGDKGAVGSVISYDTYKNYKNKNTGMISFSNKDTTHFTYTDEFEEEVRIAGDGSSILNVYFKRNVYTFTFYESESTYNNRNKVSGHTTACYPGAQNKNVTSSVSSSKKIDGIVATYTKKYSSYKCIYINGTWYEYNGKETKGTVVAPTCGGHSTPYIYQIIAKYEADISEKWAFTGTNNVKYPKSNPITTWYPKDTTLLSERIWRLENMLGGDVNFFDYSTKSDYKEGDYPKRITLNYFVESLGVSGYAYKNIYYDLYSTGADINYNHLTYQEDYVALNGYTKKNFVVINSTESNFSSGAKNVDSGDVVNFYYSRDSYTISYYVDGNRFKTESVKYQAPLSTYNITPVNTAKTNAGYTFSGWYKDPTAEVEPFDFSTTMPVGGLILYGKWQPPARNVNFTLPLGATMSGTGLSFSVPHGTTLPESVVDSAGNWTEAYTPKLEGYVFRGWRDTSDNKVVVPTAAVLRDLTLEPIMEAEEIKEWREVSVYDKFQVQRADGSYSFDGATEVLREGYPLKYQVGERFSATALEQSGYTADLFRKYIMVSREEKDNKIVFEYKKNEVWKYKVNYAIRFSSYEDAGNKSFNGKSAEAVGDYFDVPISDAKDGAGNWLSGEREATATYETVVFEMPEAYKDYYSFKGYKVTENGSEKQMGDNEYPTISKGENVVLTFYIELDDTKLVPVNRSLQYDGQQHADDQLSMAAAMGKDALTIPTGGAELQTWYFYVDDKGQPIADADVVNVGSYYTHAYVTATVNGNLYLLSKYEDESLSLQITKRKVKITSGSRTAYWDKDGILRYKDSGDEVAGSLMVANTYTVSIEGDYVDFADVDKEVRYISTVSSFRAGMEGSVPNSFSVKAKEGADQAVFEQNYSLTLVYGNLIVQGARDWKYQVNYYLRYRSLEQAGEDARAVLGDASYAAQDAEPKEILLTTGDTMDSTERFVEITASLPDDLKGYYRYAGYFFTEGNQGDGEKIVIGAYDSEGDGVKELKCYIELDPDKFAFEKELKVGKGSARSAVEQQAIAKELSEDDVWTVKKEDFDAKGAELSYRYLLLWADTDEKEGEELFIDKETLDWDAELHFYAYLVAELEGTKYLLAKDESGDFVLKVDEGSDYPVIGAVEAVEEERDQAVSAVLLPSAEEPAQLIDLGPAEDESADTAEDGDESGSPEAPAPDADDAASQIEPAIPATDDESCDNTPADTESDNSSDEGGSDEAVYEAAPIPATREEQGDIN